MPHRSSPEKAVHFPGSISAKEIAKQCTSCSKSITARERTNASSLNANRYRGCSIHYRRSFQFIKLAIPCSSKIKELYQLEVAQECIVDRLVKEGREYRQPDLAVQHDCIIAIGHILFKPTKIDRKGLISIVDIR